MQLKHFSLPLVPVGLTSATSCNGGLRGHRIFLVHDDDPWSQDWQITLAETGDIHLHGEKHIQKLSTSMQSSVADLL